MENKLANYEIKYKKHLTNALQTNNKTEINLALKVYKQPDGSANYPALFSIPTDQRLTTMAATNMRETMAHLVVGLTNAFETMNLNRPMNSNQIIDLADVLIETAGEDNLALEDVFIFLQKLSRGEYGALYESMDIPKFMDKLEIYREERYQAMKNIRDEERARFSVDRSEMRSSEKSQREESLKNTAALVAYELSKTMK